MHNPILTAFNAAHLADKFDPARHRIVVSLDGKIIGQISPERDGCHEHMQLEFSRNSLGPAFNQEQMRKRILAAAFGGNEDAFSRAKIECQPKF